MTQFFSFDPERSIEALLYLATHAKEPTKMSLLKLLYFADKTSLEKYARFITGDIYYAMQHGPVASHIYNWMKSDSETTSTLGFRVEGNKIIPLRPADEKKLSLSDIECLDIILMLYGHYPSWMIREISHQDAAWAKNWAKQTRDNNSIPIPLEDILATLDEGEELLEYLRDNTYSNP